MQYATNRDIITVVCLKNDNVKFDKKGAIVLEREIDFKEVLTELLKRWWIILVCVAACGLFAYIYTSCAVPEKFTSYGSIYVNNRAERTIVSTSDATANLYDLTTAAKLVDTYKAILKSNTFFNIIKENTDITYSAEQMKDMLRYDTVEETGIIMVYATAHTPEAAQKLCEAVLDNANTAIMNIVEVGSVKTIDEATYPTYHSYPSIKKNTMLGMVLGVCLALIIIFLINFLNVTVRTPSDIEARYNLVILGTIPDMLEIDKKKSGKDGKYEQ